MKRLRFLFGALVMAAILAAGAALAASPIPYMEFRPITFAKIVNGKSDLSTARFDHSYIRLHNLFPNWIDEIMLTIPEDTEVKYYGRDYFNPIKDPNVLHAGQNIVPIWPDPYDPTKYTVGNADGLYDGGFTNEASFSGDMETGATATFEMWYNGSPVTSGDVGPFYTTAYLKDNCAPYIELITSGGKLTGVSWKFIANSDPAQVVGLPESIFQIEVSYEGWNGNNFFGDEVGSPAASTGLITFSEPADLDKVWMVGIQIMDYNPFLNNTSCGIGYEWIYFLNKPESTKLEPATSSDVTAAENAADGLTNVPASFEPATDVGIIFDTSVVEHNFLTTANTVKTTAAIAVSEDVTPGGALVVGKITLPYNTQSLGGKTVAPFSENNYTVLKYFENGGWVDLKSLGVVDFDIPNNEVRLNATLVIIDGTPPEDEPDVTYPIDGNRNYGVKGVTDNSDKYLFVYDGVEDGVASDPVGLVDQTSGGGNSGGGNGGCNAGVAGFTVLLGALVAMAKKRVR